MKVISFNTGYFLGYTGKYREYLTKPHVGLFGSKEQESYLEEFASLVHREEPDIVLNQEIDGGSFRSNSVDQSNVLEEKLGKKFDLKFGKKYRGELFPRFPILRFMGNSLMHKNGSVKNHYLDSGRKGLVQELKLENTSIYSVHLATFGRWTRRKQIDQLDNLIDKERNFVISGDFNFHTGEKEINYIEEKIGCEVKSPGDTFPSGNPRKNLDIIAHSREIDLKNSEVMSESFSDHRPISFEIEF